MSAVTGIAGCFTRNAHSDLHPRQSLLSAGPARKIRCHAYKNAEVPHKPDARGIFEMSPPCCEATLLDARWDTFYCKLINERRLHRHMTHDRIQGKPCQCCLLKL